MKVALGADHGGFRLKEAVRHWLEQAGHQVVDFGTDSEEACDYPDIARPVAEAVARGQVDRAVLVCGTGIGMSITANKVPGVRAALCHDAYTARLSREHNDANVLCLGGRVLGPGVAEEIVGIWMSASFAGGRHARRVAKVDELDASREASR
ncbi:MAG: ribose 5-phosphate isomerase B [Bacillota bacterium]|nr:ribose 5-phosphate isomerase B [Bacillota bacterium]